MPSRLPRRQPLERVWDHQRPLPIRWIEPPVRGSTASGFHFTQAMTRLCRDIVRRCSELHQIDMRQVLITCIANRSRSRYGLQARCTPLRFQGGASVRPLRGRLYQVQRFVVDGQEMLYLVTFCLPRFQNQTYHEKLITVFHELYHIGTAFDGDLRRLPGRYQVHSHRKCDYDAKMAEFVEEYLAGEHDRAATEFLRLSYPELRGYYGGVYGVVVPRPKLLPIE